MTLTQMIIMKLYVMIQMVTAVMIVPLEVMIHQMMVQIMMQMAHVMQLIVMTIMMKLRIRARRPALAAGGKSFRFFPIPIARRQPEPRVASFS